MKKISRQGFIILFTILPGVATLVSFLYPNLSLFIKTILILGAFFICVLILAIYLGAKLNESINKIKILEQDINECQKKNDDIEEFIHQRKLFIDHSLHEIREILTEYEGYVRDVGRGNMYIKVRDEAKQVKDSILKIIREEEREFDDQLYRVSRNKNN